MIRAILPGTMDANRPMNPQATYTTADIARELGVSKMTVRNWTTRYAEFLSPAASPQPGAQRAFTQRDRIVLSFVAGMVSEGHRHEFIAQRATETTFDPNEITPADARAVELPQEATDEPGAAIAPARASDTLAIMQAASAQFEPRFAEMDQRLRTMESQNRWMIALVAGFLAGAVLIALVALLIAFAR